MTGSPTPAPSRIVGASMVGLSAILQPKVDPEAHWSEPNQITLVTEFEASSGPGPGLDTSAVPLELPALSSRLRDQRLPEV